MKTSLRLAGSLLGVGALAALLIVGSQAVRGLPQRATAENGCPVPSGDGTTWIPCSQVPTPSPTDSPSVITGPSCPDSNPDCNAAPPSSPLPVPSSPAPTAPGSSRIGPGPQEQVLQPACSLVFGTGQVVLVVAVLGPGGVGLEGASVTAYLSGPSAPAGSVSGTTATTNQWQAGGMRGANPSGLPIYAGAVPLGVDVTASNVGAYSCHGSVTYGTLSASF